MNRELVSPAPGSTAFHSQAPPAPGRPRAAAGSAIPAVAVLAVLVLSSASLSAQSANTFYKRGQRAEALQDYDTAYQDYQQAYKKDPTDLRFRVALDRIRLTDASVHIAKGRQLLQSGNTQGALVEFLHAAEIDPSDERAQQEIAKIRQMEGAPPPAPGAGLPEASGEQSELKSMGAPVRLKPLSNEPLSLHMTEDAKVIYQAVGKAAGINVLFDPDYNSKRIQVDLNNVSLLDALRIIGQVSNTFWRPVTSNTIFVAQDTRVKRTELAEQAVQTFYLTNAWQQNDLNDIQTALRNVLPNARVYGVASQNAIVMRGTPDELLLAQKLINDLDKPRPEVVIDVGVLEVSRNWEQTLGINWPGSISVALQPPNASSTSSSTSSSTTSTTTSATTTLYDLAHLKASNFAVNVGSAQLNLLLTNSNTQILADPRIRATDGQKATLTIGSRIPIATGSYSAPGITAAAAIGYAQTQFQYIDVGIKLEVTPTVHYNGDVTLKTTITDSAENGSVTIEGVTEPIISNRVADQVIRLRDGQASILGGIVNNQEIKSWAGVPGLSSIPVLKYLFGSMDHTIQNDDIVFVVIPHVVSAQQLNQQNLRAIDTGVGQSIDLRFVQHGAAGAGIQPVAMQQSQSQAQPQAELQPESQLGTVPGYNAQTAASAALSQLRTNTQTAQSPPPPASGPPSQPQAAPAPQTPPATAPGAQVAPAPQQQPGAPPAQAAQPGSPSSPSSAAPGAQGMSFQFNVPSSPLAAGTTFQVPIVLSGGADIASALLQLRYDPAHLTLVDVSAGDFLNHGGQAVPVIHRDDGSGNVMIVAALPQGTAGVSGTGTLCVLTFRAKSPGVSALIMAHAGVLNSKQQPVPAQAAQANISVK